MSVAVANRRIVPYPQWGGSVAYAHRLVPLLPPHQLYVEPFCGAAALFFSKEPAKKSVLADLDTEVIFALRYIQQLNANRIKALERFIWTNSRAGFRRAQQTTPQSPSERLWKHIYCRRTTWGAKATCVGYSTINDGDTYDLQDLWKFHQLLRGVRLVNQDWKRTLDQHRENPSALFFIDPPYVEEWDMAEGIPPEQIAEAVKDIKGNYLIAYTDSARARRAFAKGGGHVFTLRIWETKRYGAFKKASRLFVRSWEHSWLRPNSCHSKLIQVCEDLRG